MSPAVAELKAAIDSITAHRAAIMARRTLFEDLGRAKDALAGLDAKADGARREMRDIERKLPQIFAEPNKAQEALGAWIMSESAASAADILRDKPETFGKLQGGTISRRAERKNARTVASKMLPSAEDARQGVLAAGPQREKQAAAVALAQKRLRDHKLPDAIPQHRLRDLLQAVPMEERRAMPAEMRLAIAAELRSGRTTARSQQREQGRGRGR